MGIIERILNAIDDIDTRRTLGLAPRRLRHIPRLKIPTGRIFHKGNIWIKISPWRLWQIFTIHTQISNVQYMSEAEYCFETGRIVTRVTGGSIPYRLYQIVEMPDDDPETFPCADLKKIHLEFDRLREKSLIE